MYTENLVYINVEGLIEHIVIGSRMVLSTLSERELGLETPWSYTSNNVIVSTMVLAMMSEIESGLGSL